MEAALFAALADDSREAFEVYADWLVEQGDPRGEFIHVQLAREPAPADPALVAREAELLAAHAKTWLPALAAFWLERIPRVTWRRGFVDSATCFGGYQSAGAIGYGELVAEPAARLLRALELEPMTTHHGDGPDDPSIGVALHDAPPPPTLRTLAITCGDNQRAWTHVGDLSPAYPGLANVEHVVVDVGRVTLGAIELPACRSLRVWTSGMQRHVLASIANARWPRLERLELFLGDRAYGADCTLEDLAPILDGDCLPHVTALAIAGCEFGDSLAAALVTSPLLARIRSLDLSAGTLGLAAGACFVANASRFYHLERLNLDENFFPDAQHAALAALCADVSIARQQEEYEGTRYVSGAE